MIDMLFGGINVEDFFNIVMIVGLGPVVCYYAFRFGFGLCQSCRAKELNACTTCPPSDDAIAFKREVDSFLYRIARERGFDFKESPLKELFGASDKNITQYYRLAQALGVEIEIRKVSNQDIEENAAFQSQVYEKLMKDLKETDGYIGEYELNY